MDCNRNDLVTGLDAEPELSLVAIDGAIPEQQGHVVNWEELQIEERQDDEGEGRLEIFDEDQLYRLLGLRTEDDDGQGAADGTSNVDHASTNNDSTVPDVDTRGAAIPVDDAIPEERVMVYDPNKPCMDIGTVYPNMVEFRLVVRQFAINKEFALHTVKTDTARFIGKCMARDCPWHINGRKQRHSKSVMVTALIDQHNCSSSARRLTTTPTTAWVASRGIKYLRKDPSMGPKALRKELEDEHKCEIHYDTVCSGRKIAMKELFGSWDESFQMLYNWRAEVLKHSPNSVIEIDVKMVDGEDWKDLPVVELADKIREMLMVLWRKRRQIGEKLNGRILPTVIRQLKMRTRGLGHLTVISSDSFAAEIWELNTIHNRHVVKTYLRECSCLEWQHTGKPCQHALTLITAQQTVDVDLKEFVHEYYSVEKFRNAYKRLIEPLPDKTQWPHVPLPFKVGAPLDKKGARRYRKLRIKGCLEGGSGGKGKKAAKEAANEADKAATEEEAMQVAKPKRQLIRGKRMCERCGELGHGETSYKCRLNGTKKRKRKPRTNTTKYGKNGNKKSKTTTEMLLCSQPMRLIRLYRQPMRLIRLCRQPMRLIRLCSHQMMLKVLLYMLKMLLQPGRTFCQQLQKG